MNNSNSSLNNLLKYANMIVQNPLLFILSRLFRSHRARYRLWLKMQKPGPEIVYEIKKEIASLKNTPTISIILPVYNSPARYLAGAVDSVLSQLYSNWELCIADDASTSSETLSYLSEIEGSDKRIKIVRRSENGHISRASNSALDLATGEFVGLLDHDDLLEPDALLEMVKAINEHPEVDMLYSDEGKCDENDRPLKPGFKPDWSPDFLLSQMYVLHFSVYRRSLLERIDGFRVGFEGSQDFDLALRASELARKVVHIPKVLYHWRIIPGSAAISFHEKPYAYVSARRALSDTLDRRGIKGYVKYGPGFGTYSIVRDIGEPGPSTGIVLGVPKGSMGSAQLSVPGLVNGPLKVEKVALVSEDEVGDFSGKWPVDKTSPDTAEVEIIHIPKTPEGLGAAFNKATRIINTDLIVFIRLPVRPLDESKWLNSLISHALRSEVAVVGGRMIGKGHKLWNAGIVVRPDGALWYPHRGTDYNDAGHLSMVKVARNCTALSWDCMAIRKEVFEELGGFDEAELSEVYGDVDLCMKALKNGYLNVFTPECELRYITKDYLKKEKMKTARKAFTKKWKDDIQSDRYFSSHLKLKGGDKGKPIIAY